MKACVLVRRASWHTVNAVWQVTPKPEKGQDADLSYVYLQEVG